jgi:hypothetical protein
MKAGREMLRLPLGAGFEKNVYFSQALWYNEVSKGRRYYENIST